METTYNASANAENIRNTVFRGITKDSPKESWKGAIAFCAEKMKAIRAINGSDFHGWRLCRDRLCREFGKLFIGKKEITDEQIMKDISLKNEFAIHLRK